LKDRIKNSRTTTITRLFKEPPKSFFDDDVKEYEAPAKGQIFPNTFVYVLLILFGIAAILTLDWFGLLLLNSAGVFEQLGSLNALRVTAVLMSGICLPSGLLMHHYGRVYSYISEENVFFASTFSISFMLGLPCVLAWIFA
jgi:hypothetical protein